MTRDRIITAALVASLAAGAFVVVNDEDVGERPLDGRILHLSDSKLVELGDGGKGYVYPATLEDGGTDYLIADQAPCRRSLPDAGACWRLDVDGGPRFFGFLNRFPVEDMHPSSTACQPVACSVVAGEDADEDESVTLERRRDAGR